MIIINDNDNYVKIAVTRLFHKHLNIPLIILT